jgi:hypothetical protein
VAKIAEIIVEEWLNRQGYFTVRALKQVNEIDLLAYRPGKEGENDAALHVEVNDSPEPQGFLGGSNAKTRMRESVEGFIQKKYKHENVIGLRSRMVPNRDPLGDWHFLVGL